MPMLHKKNKLVCSIPKTYCRYTPAPALDLAFLGADVYSQYSVHSRDRYTHEAVEHRLLALLALEQLSLLLVFERSFQRK